MISEYSCEQCRDLMLEQSTNTLQKQMLEQHLSQCEACNESLQQLWEMQSLATRWHDEAVPRWSRRESFFGAGRWWPNLQMVASFASLFVLVMVLGQAKVDTENGFSIRFGGEENLDQKFALMQSTLQTQQRQLLKANVSTINERQVISSQLLLRTLLERSRQERREELSTILTTWDYVQSQQAHQTRESLEALLLNQMEDRRNIKQLNQFLTQAALEGNNL